MLFRFQSKAAADVVMLPAHGKRLLEILGKNPDAPGIVQLVEMPAAVAALHAAADAEEMLHQREQQAAEAQGESTHSPDGISLRTRVTPFIQMLQHSMREGCDVVWGV